MTKKNDVDRLIKFMIEAVVLITIVQSFSESKRKTTKKKQEGLVKYLRVRFGKNPLLRDLLRIEEKKLYKKLSK